ncbi:hypothetical protein [Photobacterium leiognathi]|uniref:hypothetical protein n=1 Tax=Photobacterium leiognathi TaxID=553611 RepID=UPI000769C99B|nr:hypothetical protein [Photobacterium leiognathi]
MTYGNGGIGDNYAFDGMYCNIDRIISQDEEDKLEDERRLSQLSRERLKLKLMKHLSKYSNHEDVLFHTTRYLLKEQKNNLILNYLKKEELPCFYKDVVNQRDALQILIRAFFINVVGSELDYFEYNRLEELVVKVSENKDRETAYSRVTEIRSLIYDIVDYKSEREQLKLPLDLVETKNLLSACRISLLLSDFLNKHVNYQSEVNERTKKEFAYEISRPLENAKLANGKSYIARWKARHLHTLEYYASAEIGRGLRKLQAIDISVDIEAYKLAAIEVCLDYEY